MDVIGYVAAASDEAIGDPLGFAGAGRAPGAQQQMLERWARRSRHRIVAVVRETTIPSLGAVPERLGLGEVLERLQDGGAHAMVVAGLDRLGADVVTQEQLLAEVARLGARCFSTVPAEASLFANPPSDPLRAAVRTAVRTTPAFGGDLRALRARLRMRHLEDGQEIPALVEIEHLGERGMMIGELAKYLRERRAAERGRPQHCAWWRRKAALRT